jgi:murein DD-endopeptidase MepM/ murein hydrolase activator NlpD
VRTQPNRPSPRRALIVVVALALLLLPTQAVGAAGDPLAEAEARVTAARRAANSAAEKYEDAQTTYYTLQDEIERTQQQIAGMQQNADQLGALARSRALEAYKGGNSDLDAIMDGNNVLDAMRRSALLDRVNAEGNDAVDQLGAMTEDLNIRQDELNAKLGRQEELLSALKAREQELRSSLAAAEQAEQQLRERLERERRERELQERLARARAAAASSSAKKSGGAAVLPRPSRSVVINGFTCPVPGSSFGDSFGSPRSGGRRHQGVDMMAGFGTPIYAAVSGSVGHSTSGLGGNQIWLSGSDGNKYFYAHLQSYVGGSGAVSAGDQIGLVGDTGNARGTPHLHFEIHPGGGAAVNPYPTVRAAC